MKNLIFYYSAMKGAKSMLLIQRAYNYNENGKKTLVMKPAKDTKGDHYLISRNGSKREVDVLLGEKERLISEQYIDKLLETDVILVDEAQFLSSLQVEELWKISKAYDKDVMCYGLRTNFKGELFEGSKRLMELSDSIRGLDTINLCLCGNQAQFNARLENGNFTYEGEEVAIDGANQQIEYQPLCGRCYLQKVFVKMRR